MLTGCYNDNEAGGFIMSQARENILIAMARLIEKQGYHATGLNEIIQESGAPKGSIYYYFPGGKEQIGAEAILESGRIIAARLQSVLAAEPDPAKAIYSFLVKMAESVEQTDFGASSPLTTAAIETAVTSEALNQASRQAFDLILNVFKQKLLSGGFTEDRAADLALFVTTVIEGGIVMSRTYHNSGPLRQAADHISRCIIH
jgi:TetR/AcrR family transcriptional regulator, lmrAB and yxaGH operons repressor